MSEILCRETNLIFCSKCKFLYAGCFAHHWECTAVKVRRVTSYDISEHFGDPDEINKNNDCLHYQLGVPVNKNNEGFAKNAVRFFTGNYE